MRISCYRLFLLIVGILLSLEATAAVAETRVALVIGNNRYDNLDKDRQLHTAGNDARAVGDALEKDGFTVLRGSDLSRAEIVDKLYEMTSKLHSGDTALFYFAGHGVALGNGNYLLPSDVPDIGEGQELRLASQAIAESDVIATLQDKYIKVAIIILDACRNNPFRRPGLRSVGAERGLERMPEANGVFTLYSAGYGQTALDRLSGDDQNPNSVFTRVLVPMLTLPGVNLDDLSFDVREQVAKLAATTPDHHFQVPAAYNQIVGGRVYLVNPAPPVNSAPAPVQPSISTPLAVETATREPPVDSVESSPSPVAITASIQTELNRLGCDAGVPNGWWTPRSRDALLRITRLRHIAVNVDKPDAPALDALLGLVAPGCPTKRRGLNQTAHRPSPLYRAPELSPTRKVAQEVEPQRQLRKLVPRVAPTRASINSKCFSFNGQRVCD